MNGGAIAEIAALDPDAVLVKGDLTDRGSEEEYRSFLDAYTQLGPRMYHTRGNHDAMISHQIAVNAPHAIELPGVTLAVIDTVRPGSEHGRITNDQLEWLDDVADASSNPVLVFGHHHPWDPSSTERSEHYFGINPDDSEALCAVIARRESIAGYFAGHTHRNRVRRFDAARGVPIVEIACVKDYPGAWAEYRIYEGGYTQLAHRIATPAAMAWTEQTRAMFAGLYRDYALGRLGDRCFTQVF
jgi:3',5'-cyclic AMP phosphodiesterase CpdA